jgi:hypothetical protein
LTGAIAWRFISGNNSKGNYVETVGSERQIYPFHEDLTYFVKATWRGGLFNVTFVEGGVNGTIIYNFGKPYDGIYQPSPHNVYIGSPFKGGDRGDPHVGTPLATGSEAERRGRRRGRSIREVLQLQRPRLLRPVLRPGVAARLEIFRPVDEAPDRAATPPQLAQDEGEVTSCRSATTRSKERDAIRTRTFS